MKSLFYLCIGLTGFRFVFTAIMGLMPQDAYYDFYARHLALSYYDHPPIIAYLLRLFTTLFGRKVFAIKLADTTITVFTLIAFYQLSKKFLSKQKAWSATFLLISTFLISILSLVTTPDVPLMLFWTLSLFFLHEAIFKKKNICWIWAGIMTGFSFDSKYTSVFLIVGLFGFLLISKTYRKLLISGWFILYLLCFFVAILPVTIWNYRNEFASFKFQSEGRIQEGVHIDLNGFFGVIGHQTAILLPFLFLSFIYFIYRFVRKYGIHIARIPNDQLFLLCFFIPIFIGFFSLSFIYWVKLNWMMPAYISGILWVSRYWNKKWIRYQLIFSVILHLLMAIQVIYYVVPIRSDDTWFGWQSFSEKVQTLRKQYPKAFIFSARNYKTAAILNFYLPEMIYSKNIYGEKALQFDFIGTDLNVLYGKDALLLNSNPQYTDLENEKSSIPAACYNYFDRIIPLMPILIEKNGRVERKFSVFLCKNYHSKIPHPKN